MPSHVPATSSLHILLLPSPGWFLAPITQPKLFQRGWPEIPRLPNHMAIFPCPDYLTMPFLMLFSFSSYPPGLYFSIFPFCSSFSIQSLNAGLRWGLILGNHPFSISTLFLELACISMYFAILLLPFLPKISTHCPVWCPGREAGLTPVTASSKLHNSALHHIFCLPGWLGQWEAPARDQRGGGDGAFLYLISSLLQTVVLAIAISFRVFLEHLIGVSILVS